MKRIEGLREGADKLRVRVVRVAYLEDWDVRTLQRLLTPIFALKREIDAIEQSQNGDSTKSR